MNDAAIDDQLESMDFNLDEIDYMINPNTLMLETAKLIKAALINNQHSEKPVSELDVLHKMVKEREKAMAIYEKAGS